MILVDSSVWMGHFRKTEPRLEGLLANELVSLHPFVLGELACGNLSRRAETIARLEKLPVAAVASEPQVRHLLESRRLWGTGLGWIDMHLLASAMIEGLRLWSADRAMAAAAKQLGIAFSDMGDRLADELCGTNLCSFSYDWTCSKPSQRMPAGRAE